MDSHTVAIVGAGLVGSVCACLMAQRGYAVDLYDYRDDLRQTPLLRGRSINLALSHRGRLALRAVGVEDEVISHHAVPMWGRLIHDVDGGTTYMPYDHTNKNCVYSVSRRRLNELLLREAEKKKVRLHFNHRLVKLELDLGQMTFSHMESSNQTKVKADLVVGADGAYSTVRRQLLKTPLVNYSQQYIEHGYLELTIHPKEDNKDGLRENCLHIWPRKQFMMIALPNLDRSWTVTLFMNFDKFDGIRTPDQLLDFFNEYFPDAVPLIGKENLVHDFFATHPGFLISIKCHPYHYGSKAVLVGDAAHAVVPFYGQGMNAGFEDVIILDELLAKYNGNFANALSEFSEIRCKDGHAIADLAMYNYIEILVTSAIIAGMVILMAIIYNLYNAL